MVPKGVGALWIRRGVRLQSTLTGGKQERGRRSGTENVAGIVGMGVAAREALSKLASEQARLAALRDKLESLVLSRVPGTARNGAEQPRVANTANISFDRIEAESLLIALDLEGIAVSTGSACSSGTLEPSHVLKAMGLPRASHAELDSIQPRRGEHRRRRRARGCRAAGHRGKTAKPHTRAGSGEQAVGRSRSPFTHEVRSSRCVSS